MHQETGEMIPGWLRAIGLVFLMLSVYGLVYSPSEWKPGSESGMSWWQYVLVLPVIGLGAAIGEALLSALVTPIFAPFQWNSDDQPWWKTAVNFVYVSLVVLVAVGILVAIVWWAWKVISAA